ncbi:MAG: DNA glycosylase AlkZ-like family protein [Nitriliruptorales bacterium]
MRLTWDRVLAWRMRRQLLDPRSTADAVAVVRRLCGVHAQVASSAELAVAARQLDPHQGEVDAALATRVLMKTWAMRGTLHLLPPEQAGAYLSLVAAARSWERPSWQRAFGVSAADMAALIDAVADALDRRVLDRDELVAEVVARTGSRHLEAQLRSGWGALLKPLAWLGHLCHGPSKGNRVTFTRPDTWLPEWRGVPEPQDGARFVIPAYLRAYGPARMETFDGWLTRGISRKLDLRAWFATLDDELVTVDVEGQECYALAEDVDEIAATAPTTAVRLLPGFDQWVLAPGTGDERIVPARRRSEVSKSAGWISPVVIVGGHVVGVWQLEGKTLAVRLFEEAGGVAWTALGAEAEHIEKFLARDLRLSVASE